MNREKSAILSGRRLIKNGILKKYQECDLAGYHFILRDTAVPYTRFLSEILSEITTGRIENKGVRPVAAGRERIFFITLPDGEEVVVRPYRHGGIFGAVSGSNFHDPARFISELAVTEKARVLKITALEPVGIGYVQSKRGVWGVWMSRRLKESCNLQMWMRAFPPSSSVIFQVAESIGKMHQAGISHPDLTVQNIMVMPDSRHQPAVSIIDFDGAMMRAPLSAATCMRQLRRLDRSFLKWIPETSPWQTPIIRLRFAAAYGQFNPEIRPLMRNYLRKIRQYMLRYRVGWRLQKILKGV